MNFRQFKGYIRTRKVEEMLKDIISKRSVCKTPHLVDNPIQKNLQWK